MNHYGAPRTRDEGVELYQTTPDRIAVHHGADDLVAVKVSPSDMIRWVAGCCDTPMFLSPDNPRLSLVGLILENVDDLEPFGPVVTESFMGTGNEKGRHKQGWRMAWGGVSRAISSQFSGAWRQTIFFDLDTGRPTTEPVLLPRSGGR